MTWTELFEEILITISHVYSENFLSYFSNKRQKFVKSNKKDHLREGGHIVPPPPAGKLV